jgi:hypothetical protein
MFSRIALLLSADALIEPLDATTLKVVVPVPTMSLTVTVIVTFRPEPELTQ